MNSYFHEIYRGRTVLVTGHTGFKGSWLSLWLTELGARVVGYSLPPPTQPNHFDLLRLPMESIEGDVRDAGQLRAKLQACEPQIVFHLAAQPLVRVSYREPAATYETNILGTVNLLEACRRTPSVRAIVCVTSDKVYENREAPSGYMLVGQQLLEGQSHTCDAWNFGPEEEGAVEAERVVQLLEKHWPQVTYRVAAETSALPETKILKLDSTKAHRRLKWRSI